MGTMLLGGLWHGASWNFVLWGFMHGLLLIIHRTFKDTKPVVNLFEKLPRISCLLGWVVTQYFVFMTWLVFRLEDTSLLIPSLKTYVGIGGHWDISEMNDVLPEVRMLTFAIAIIFIIGHFVSWKIGGLKNWISRQNSVVWGICIGVMLMLALSLRPVETVDFIYFRF
jgi:D-alanyl-lipoteichoic acid acyltransferase DltB (MBOAT superfamily)